MFSDFFWKNIHNPQDLNWKAIIFWSDRKGIMDQCRHRKSSWTCPRCWSVIHSSLRCTFWRVAHDVFLKTVVQPSLQNGCVKKVLKVSKKGTEASSSNFDCQDVCDFWRFVLFRGRHVLGYHCYHFPLEPVRYGGFDLPTVGTHWCHEKHPKSLGKLQKVPWTQHQRFCPQMLVKF